MIDLPIRNLLPDEQLLLVIVWREFAIEIADATILPDAHDGWRSGPRLRPQNRHRWRACGGFAQASKPARGVSCQVDILMRIAGSSRLTCSARAK
jgi:hypothetical protein